MKALLISFIFIVCSVSSFGQSYEDIEYFSAFYAVGWISDFNDTIVTYSDAEDVPENVKYCLVLQKEDGTHDLLNWEKKEELVDPILWQEKLTLNLLKNSRVKLKIGGRTDFYYIKMIDGKKTFVMRYTPGNPILEY
ncbi:MAG: hypothetical protein HRT71_02530 [Flavobacteriales bacterium]|nr:hypothetical protein [Flavobacteriales bacterium]